MGAELSVVASDIFGVSGRAMMAALVAGERDPKRLSEIALGRMRSKTARLQEAFVGRFNEHHAFMLATMLSRVDQLTADIAAAEARTEEQIAPSLQRSPDGMRFPASAWLPRR